MPTMKEIAARRNVPKRKLNKEEKKQLDRALKQALKLSIDGQIAVMQDGNGHKHIMIREDKLNEAIQNVQKGLGFVTQPSKELLDYNKLHQEVLQVMSKLDYEELGRDQFDSDEDYDLHKKIVKRNQDLFDDIDQFTFEFSEGLMNGKNYRKNVVDNYKKFRESHPEIDEILKSRVVEAKVV